MPLIRRMPKRGFPARPKTDYQIVNLEELNRFKAAVVTPELLEKEGLIKNKERRVKILGDGELKNALVIRAHAFSKAAEDKIKGAGGTVEVIDVQRAG